MHSKGNSRPPSSSSSSSYSSSPPSSIPPSSSPTTTATGGLLSFSPPSLPPSLSLSRLVLPKQLSDAVMGVEGTRSFAQARLKTHSINNNKGGKWEKIVCALVPSRGGSSNRGEGGGEEGEALVVLTAEGHCYQYAVDVREGGTCRLVEEKTLLQEEAGSQALAPRLLSG